MKQNPNRITLLRIIASVICFGLPTLFLILNPNISVQTILSYTPENTIAAACVLMIIYAVKSILVFFPLIILQIVAGSIFPPLIAIAINLLGILVVLTIPYLLGRLAGIRIIEQLTEKYPKFQHIINQQHKSSLFLCFFLRSISCLPGDLITMYFGATKTPFSQNLVGGALGILPGMILATIMGNSIQDPDSPAFWISLLLTIAISVASALFYYFYQHKKENNSK